jgi:hypothetical protein
MLERKMDEAVKLVSKADAQFGFHHKKTSDIPFPMQHRTKDEITLSEVAKRYKWPHREKLK